MMVSDQVSTDVESWEKSRSLGSVEPPTPRSFHSSCIFGAGLFVWGGVDSYTGAKIESDWHLFDFGLGCWIQVNVT